MLQFIDSFQMGLPGLSGTVSGIALAVADATLDLDFTKNRFSQPMGPELVDNAGFDNGLAGFTNLSTGTATLTATGGRATGVGQDSANAAVIRKVVTVTAGKTYRVDMSITSSSGGNFRIGSTVGGSDLNSSSRNIGVHTNIVTATTTTLSVSLSTYSAGSTYELDYISIREVNPANLGLELLVNGDFTTNINGWAGSAVTAGVVTWSAGQAVVGAHTAGVSFGQDMVNTVAGRQYEATLVIAAITASPITFAVGNLGIGDTGLASMNAGAPGEYRLQFIAKDNTSQPFVYKGAAGTLTIERMSVREVNPSIETLLTASRASPGFALGMDGIYREFGPNVPRITDKGLLIEEGRTNIALWNDDFTNGIWTKGGTSVELVQRANVFGAPTTAKVVESTANQGHSLRQTNALNMGVGPHTASFILEAAERYVVTMLLFENGGSYVSAHFNLRDGTFVMGNTSLAGKATMEPLGAGRYLCSVTGTFAVGATGCYFDFRLSNRETGFPTSGDSYQGDGVSGIYVHHGQLELGGFPLSPIRTGATQATRAGDMVSTPAGPWFNPVSGTLYADVGPLAVGSPSGNFPASASLDDGTTAERLAIRREATTLRVQAIVYDGAVIQAGITQAVWDGASPLKAALAYAPNDFAFAERGFAPGVDTTGTLPTVTQLSLGSTGNAFLLNGTLKRVAYYSRRLSNTELVTLTT